MSNYHGSYLQASDENQETAGVEAAYLWGEWWACRDSVESEKWFQSCVVQVLSNFWNCIEQPAGTYVDPATGKETRLRGDIMCLPQDESTTQWRLGPFVVELKRPERGCGAPLGKHIKQAFDYRMTKWDQVGDSLPVLMCPGLQGPVFKDWPDPENRTGIVLPTHHRIWSHEDWKVCRRILGPLDIGEMFFDRQWRMTVLMSGHALVHQNKLTRQGTMQKRSWIRAGAR